MDSTTQDENAHRRTGELYGTFRNKAHFEKVVLEVLFLANFGQISTIFIAKTEQITPIFFDYTKK